jgi:hypothetical protein
MSQPARSPLYVCLSAVVGVRRTSSPRLTRQLQCVLTPHRLGGATGRPRRLGTRVPSFPPTEQHNARHAEGVCVTSRV